MKLLKIKSPIGLFLLSLAFLSPLLTGKIWATDLNINCSDKGCEPAVAEPLFNSDPANDGYWYPGRTLTKTINLKNSSSETREMAIKGERTSEKPSILEKVMQISITGGGVALWGGSLKEFYDEEKISLGSFNSEASFDYNFTASMNINADNDYQNKETTFKLILGFWSEPTPSVTPSPTLIPKSTTPTSTFKTTKTMATTTKAVLGTGVSASVCSDAKPGLPTNFTAVAGPGAGQVTLSWTPPALPYTYFLIAYSNNPDSPKWGNPNISASATSYIVSGLGGGTYWFWLRAGNGCATGDFVGPIAVTLGGIAGAGPLAPGFAPVLGEKTPGEVGKEGEATQTAKIGEGRVEGEKVQAVCWWWLILSALEAVLLTVFYLLTKEKGEIRRWWWLVSLILAGLAFVGDQYIAHRSLIPSRFCSFMWLWAIIAALIPNLIFRPWKNKS
jgi:hypothetical protein